jgi:hypothetical protein
VICGILKGKLNRASITTQHAAIAAMEETWNRQSQGIIAVLCREFPMKVQMAGDVGG